MPYSRNELVNLRKFVVSQPASQVIMTIPKELQRNNEEPVPLLYERFELLQIRQSRHESNESSSSAVTPAMIPEEIRRKNCQTKVYSRDQLLAVKKQNPIPLSTPLPDEICRQSRFRCESDCANEKEHEIKKILKYSRSELVLLRDTSSTDSAATSETAKRVGCFAAQTMAMAPEIFVRSLGR